MSAWRCCGRAFTAQGYVAHQKAHPGQGLTVETFRGLIEMRDGCWAWVGHLADNGYGKFGGVYAHRWSWEHAFGPIPEGLSVLHRCDNPPCVNPEHLFLGTQLDNMRDCKAKGRIRTGRTSLPGELNAQAKLTAAVVIAARLRRTAGDRYVDMAAEFGVTLATIRDAVIGRSWAHLPGALGAGSGKAPRVTR